MFIDYGAENHIDVRMGHFADNGRCLVSFVQSQIWATRNVEQDAARTIDRHIK